MRLWSIHPRYLDTRGLVALWREALLAQAVLRGRTQGYTHHPQLLRFRAASKPIETIAAYLQVVHDEATRRGYNFNRRKIGRSGSGLVRIPVTHGQMLYERKHLRLKLAQRAPEWLKSIKTGRSMGASPVFEVVPGPVETWEKRLL